jgi:hypothetical protein
MASAQEINELTAKLIKSVGVEVGTIDHFGPKMVCIEGLMAGLIVLAVHQHNKQPDELVEAFCSGLRARVTALIYGRPQ